MMARRGIHMIVGRNAIKPELLFVDLLRFSVELDFLLNAMDIMMDCSVFACID